MNDLIRTRRSTLASGTAVGAVTFLVGYLLTWILAGTKVARLAVSGPFGGSVPDWKALLWLVYDGHFVGTRTPQVFGPGGDLWGGGDLVDTVGLLGVEYLYAVPAVLLVLAGAAVASLVGTADPRTGMRTGMTVAVGYLAAVVLGLFVASQAGVAPSPLRALVIAGVVYPVAFGSLGGAAVGLFAREMSERSGESVAR